LTTSKQAETDYAANGGELFESFNKKGTDGMSGPTDYNAGTVSPGRAGWSPVAATATGIFYGASQTTMADIIDGTTNTYLCGEKFLDPAAYTTGSDAGDDQNLYTGCQDDVVRWVGAGADTSYAPRQDRSDQNNVSIFGSAHSGGFNVAMCDASVRLVSYSIDLETHRRLGNRKDQLPIDGSKL
jgi:prepilin-type processing-associated H-X9-DG protein